MQIAKQRATGLYLREKHQECSALRETFDFPAIEKPVLLLLPALLEAAS